MAAKKQAAREDAAAEVQAPSRAIEYNYALRARQPDDPDVEYDRLLRRLETRGRAP
jgi:hypothetical protein